MDLPWWVAYMELPPNWPPPWELVGEEYSILWLYRLGAFRAEREKARKAPNGNQQS